MFAVAATARRAEAYESLARSLRSGLPLTTALHLVTHCGRMTEAMATCATGIEKGMSFTEALAWAGRGEVPREELRLLQAGEEAGRLPELLTRLSSQLEQRAGRRRRMVAGLIYPWILINASILAVGAPLVVQGLGTFLAFALPKLLLLWGVTLAGLVFTRRVARSEQGRRRLRDTAAQFPLIGRAARLRAAAEYAHAVSIGIDAGLPLGQSLELGAQAAAWSPLTAAATRIAREIRSGTSVADAHAGESLVPREIVASVRAGESAGTLDDSFAAAARSLDEQATRSARKVSVAIPATIYLLVAVLVAWVVISGYARLLSLPGI